MDLVDALRADRGVVAVVGAGGKKSTMYRLAGRLERAVVTATVRIPIFDPHVARVVVTDDPVGAVETTGVWPLGLVPGREGDDRYRGYPPATVDRIGGIEDVTAVLVKADGARMREFKAPNDREPRIPGSTRTVLPVVSAHVVGRPLEDDLVHRVDRVAAIAGVAPGEALAPRDVATVLASPEGGLRGVPEGATAVPVINKVDDERLLGLARTLADELLERGPFPRVVLTRMVADDPLVEVAT